MNEWTGFWFCGFGREGAEFALHGRAPMPDLFLIGATKEPVPTPTQAEDGAPTPVTVASGLPLSHLGTFVPRQNWGRTPPRCQLQRVA